MLRRKGVQVGGRHWRARERACVAGKGFGCDVLAHINGGRRRGGNQRGRKQ